MTSGEIITLGGMVLFLNSFQKQTEGGPLF